jgi:hypothetical protein
LALLARLGLRSDEASTAPAGVPGWPVWAGTACATRWTLDTEMLRQGGNLVEIAQVTELDLTSLAVACGGVPLR